MSTRPCVFSDNEGEDSEDSIPAQTSNPAAATKDMRERTCNPLTGQCRDGLKANEIQTNVSVCHTVCVCVFGPDALSGVSNIFSFWGSESREEPRYQEVPCSHSLPSPPPQPPSLELLDMPFCSHCPSSTAPPLSIPWRKKVELEKRLEALQTQITRWVTTRLGQYWRQCYMYVRLQF